MTIEESPRLNKSEEVADRLRRGVLSETEFIDALSALDQSTPERSNAQENSAVLEAQDIKTQLTRSEARARYYDLLSLTYFHLAQQQAENPTLETIALFHKALKAAREVTRTDPNFGGIQDWIDYVEGNVAYFENDSFRLSLVVDRMTEEGRNKNILMAFLDGLTARSAPDWLADLQTVPHEETLAT